jgi:hypothetical protein
MVGPLSGLEIEWAAADHVGHWREAAGWAELDRRAERVAGGEADE